MASNEEGDETAPRRNEWEVVSLTASAYDAAPGPRQADSSHDVQGKFGGEDEAEASNAMVNSQHFIFPPNQHENLPLEPEHSESSDEKGGDFDVSQLVENEEDKPNVRNEENVSIKELMSSDIPGIPTHDEKGNWLSTSGADKSISGSAEVHSSHHEDSIEEGGETDDISSLQDHTSDPGLLDSQMPDKAGDYDDTNLPYEAWWKRRAVSLYAQAKEAKSLWSIFIAAAVMGLVIIGHQWQQERWQVLHLKWQSGVGDQRMGRILGSIYRVKDVIVGGHQRRSFLPGTTSAQH